ncbi:hypothetical protein [Pseudomonas syringae]|uniref:hypothetical protein n=1 Tax=Pseudomonas syringae TaxID=317 RepID=UPI00190F90C2|nr:hypothetical protein [Pseudomonas syringae]
MAVGAKEVADTAATGGGKVVANEGTLNAGVDAASGIVGGVGSYAGMMATSPVCLGVLTCALPAGLGVLGTQQLVVAWDSASQINSDFTSDQPGRVEAAFHLETFPGESSITKDLAASAGQSVLEMSVFGLAGKYFNGLSTANGVVFPWGGEGIGGATGKVVDTLDPVQAARQRQAAMLEENQGFNMSPIGWDKYPTIGRNGTCITDGEAISSITGMSPNSPLQGNEYFQGAGQHLPGGGPEMVIDSIPTVDSAKVKTITTVIVK